MVAHIRDAPVGKIVKRAVKAPDLRRTETDLLDNAAVAGNRNIITDVDLFFQKDKKSGDDVTDKPLSPEADGETDHAGAGNESARIVVK